MYYVGLLHDIRHGCVYTSIEEARKEIHRNLQTGQMVLFTNLPPSKEYWVAGTIGETMNTKFNFIFADKEGATAHVQAKAHYEELGVRGWPQAQRAIKKLEVVAKGPADPDIRTQEHLDTERRLQRILRAIEQGVPVSNANHSAGFVLLEDEPNTAKLIFHNTNHVIMQVGDDWGNLEVEDVFTILRNLRKLCGEIANVDPDTQPRKWARLQQQANDLWAQPLRLPDFAQTEEELEDALDNPPSDTPQRNS